MWLRFADGEIEARGDGLRTGGQEVTDPNPPSQALFPRSALLSPEPSSGIPERSPRMPVGTQVGVSHRVGTHRIPIGVKATCGMW